MRFISVGTEVGVRDMVDTQSHAVRTRTDTRNITYRDGCLGLVIHVFTVLSHCNLSLVSVLEVVYRPRHRYVRVGKKRKDVGAAGILGRQNFSHQSSGRDQPQMLHQPEPRPAVTDEQTDHQANFPDV